MRSVFGGRELRLFRAGAGDGETSFSVVFLLFPAVWDEELSKVLFLAGVDFC